MKKIYYLVIPCLVLMACVFSAESAIAAPGGYIAQEAFSALPKWLKTVAMILMIALFLLLSPLIVYSIYSARRAEKNLRSQLSKWASHSPLFSWLSIRDRITDCFAQIHSAWSEKDMSKATAWMTDWYWQNQQLAHLERWKREGLENICTVEKITAIRPILFVPSDKDPHYSGSRLVVEITAQMQDYLRNILSGQIVKGDQKFHRHSSLWSFVLDNDTWKVANIEDSAMLGEYRALARQLESEAAQSQKLPQRL